MPCATAMRENARWPWIVTAEAAKAEKVQATAPAMSAAGCRPDLPLVGSEGTLGIFTEITLRIYPLPEAVSAAICSFPASRTPYTR